MRKTKSKKEEIMPEETSPITEEGAEPTEMDAAVNDEAMPDDLSLVEDGDQS